MTLHGAELHSVAEASVASARSKRAFPAIVISAAAIALLAAQPSAAQAPKQPTPAPTPTNVGCPTTGQDLIKAPELVRSPEGVLRGTIFLQEEPLRVATSASGVSTPVAETCAEQLARLFLIKDANGNYITAPKANPPSNILDPFPGPTLRARVGDLVQVGFVNVVNSARFDRNFELDECMKVTSQAGQVYPILTNGVPNDVHPNCLHASSTANIHYHGTHTNPNSFGDNVYLEIPPLPRDNQGNLTTTPAQVMAGFDKYFDDCTANLKPTPLKYWPATWDDLPKPYLDKQKELLLAYQNKFPGQDLLKDDEESIKNGQWPIYYIGAVPHCFALPAYTAGDVWPPPPGSTSPNMGQSPGTHWYHAHKHGSTHINVLNGMSGAFIIEGKYDDDLNAGYGSYMLKDGAWNTRAQPVLVLNQLATDPNLLTPRATHFLAGQPANIDMSVNGRLRPKVQMQLGEVQMWRIVNSSPRNALYFMAPEGFKWRQIAQDGVQFTDDNYRNSENKPFYIAPANRVDLLVQAPMQKTTLNVLVQQVMGRAQAQPTPANPNVNDPKPGTVLMTIEVKGPPEVPAITQNGRPITTPMPFIAAPTQPAFLTDITDEEIRRSNYPERRLEFNSGPPGSTHQHTINGKQFSEGGAMIQVVLSAVEQWTIVNTTSSLNGPKGGGGVIDHPLHIHINPFQVTEFFDPNENLTDPKTGQLLGVLTGSPPHTVPVPKYIPVGTPKTDPRQCYLDPDKPATWVPCDTTYPPTHRVWWDVFAIPSARANLQNSSGKTVNIPGYYKMRSRFVDFAGLYVLHCHILVHEDRGMMFSVEVIRPKPVFVHHH